MVYRPDSGAPPHWYQTYTVSAPISTHWVKATCEEIGCFRFLNGWKAIIDTSTELGRRQFHFLTHSPRRKATVTKTGPTLFEFSFEKGQPCFQTDEHKRKLDRPEHYLLRGGNQRGFERNSTQNFTRADDWMDHFATHQDKINKRISNRP
jgi:hypothetical protein